jgi:hypothetical protein
VLRADNIATFMCRLSANPGSLSLLEPSRPVGLYRDRFTLTPVLRSLMRDMHDLHHVLYRQAQLQVKVKLKVKVSRYRPEQALEDPVG